MKLLPAEFYLPSASEVARSLLGHWLLRKVGDEWIGGMIVETEGYVTGDPACHAYRGETKRNRVMWGEPGHAYVYLIYGFHHCVNAVCRPRGVGEAVLIRAIEPTFGIEILRRNRAVADAQLTNGPGKLCAALQIGRELDGANLTKPDSELVLAANPDWKRDREKFGPTVTTNRVGISVAADWPLRFYLEESEWVSRRKSRRSG